MPNLVNKHSISFELAQKMVASAVATASEIGVSENVVILDDGGNLKAFGRMDGAPLPTIEMAQNKAYTALLGVSTQEFTAKNHPRPTNGPFDSNPEHHRSSTMSKPLENKIALVTGSSRGIGAAIVIRLAAEGASVIVNYSGSPARADAVVAQIKKAGGNAEAVKADLGKAEGSKTLMAAVDKAFEGKFAGRLDILVNNAGTIERGPFLDSSDQSYDKHFNLNVRSPIELSKASAKRMVKTGWGRIINIGSASEKPRRSRALLFTSRLSLLYTASRGVYRAN